MINNLITESFVEWLMETKQLDEVLELLEKVDNSKDLKLARTAKHQIDEYVKRCRSELGASSMKPLNAYSELYDYKLGKWKNNPHDFLA